MEHNKRVFIIVGAPRSGFSVIAECLGVLGIKIGFLDSGLLAVHHDVLFRDLGCTWNMVGNLPQDWLESEPAQQAGEKLREILFREMQKTDCLGIVDPRLTRLLPLWSKLLDESDWQPYYLHLVRHPLEVALSLQKKHGLDSLKGLLLWFLYNRAAMTVCHHGPYCALTYDQLVTNPLQSLHDAGRLLGIEWPLDLHNVSEALLSKVKPHLKNHHAGQMAQSIRNYQVFVKSYQQLQQYIIQRRLEGSPAQYNASPAETLEGQTPGTEKPNSVFNYADSFFHQNKDFSEIVHSLLELVGHYEREDLKLEMREKRVLVAEEQGKANYVHILFPQGPNEYSEQHSSKCLIMTDEWQMLSVDLPNADGLRQGKVKIIPMNSSGMIRISSLNLVNLATGKVLWSANADNGFAGCEFEGYEPFVDKDGALTMVTFGQDQPFFLPLLNGLPDVPLRLETWVHFTKNLEYLNNLFSPDEALQYAEERRRAMAKKLNTLQIQYYEAMKKLSTFEG